MKMLGFFCVLLRREVYEKVGEMDEQFGVGYFEDTDYCCRVARAGLRTALRPRRLRASLAGRLVPPAGRTTATPTSTSKTNACSKRKWGADSMAGAY